MLSLIQGKIPLKIGGSGRGEKKILQNKCPCCIKIDFLKDLLSPFELASCSKLGKSKKPRNTLSAIKFSGSNSLYSRFFGAGLSRGNDPHLSETKIPACAGREP